MGYACLNILLVLTTNMRTNEHGGSTIHELVAQPDLYGVGGPYYLNSTLPGSAHQLADTINYRRYCQ